MIYFQFRNDGVLSAKVRSETAPEYAGYQFELPADSPYNFYQNGKLYKVDYVDGPDDSLLQVIDTSVEPKEILNG